MKRPEISRFGQSETVGSDVLGESERLAGEDADLRSFYCHWINFYRIHRKWLCSNIQILGHNVIAHGLPDQLLVFLFNEQGAARDMSLG